MIERNIVCPNCKAVQSVKNVTDAPVMEITCAQCGARLGVKFLALTARPSDDQETIIDAPRRPSKQYRLRVNGMEYRLMEGENSIGRQASTSEASVQIATESRKMSRMHAKIEVLPAVDGRAVLSNWHNKNTTSVNGRPVGENAQVPLHHGDRILMGDVEMIFEEF